MSIASIFNAYFTGVGQTLAEKKTKDKYYKQPKIEEPITELNLPQVTPAIIKKHIENLSKNKSSGLKELPIKTIKAAKDVIAKGLSHIINKTLEQGKIPLRWKSAIITPTHKGGKKDIVNNYRPISVLPFMDKILERIIKERLMTHLENQHCITENQGGYRKNYSTITMTRKLVDHILTNRESNTPTLAVFIDLAKAFDTISHAGLIRKLQLYGIKDIELNLIRDYLSHRTQQTSINGILSDPEEINFGVPQGSVLGPIFFLLYINDITKVIKRSEICLFADDTVIYNSNKDYQIAENELQEDLNSVNTWLNNNELTINIKKSKVMTFNKTSNKATNVTLKISEQNLDIVDSYKYLGLILDDKLSFQKHLYYTAGRVRYKLRKLKEIRGNIKPHTAVTIFKSLIKPHLDYCDIIWDAAGVSLKNNLQSIQEKALSLCFPNVKDLKQIHKDTKTLPINLRTEMHLVQHMYNIVKLPSPTFLTSTVNYVSHSYSTRGREQKNLRLMKPRTESLRKTVHYRAGQAWNKLPSSLRLCNDKLQFKTKIKEHYLKGLM